MTDHYKHRREQEDELEDRLTALHDDLLIYILSFLPIKQRVTLSAVCTRFGGLLPFIPRLDIFQLEVGRHSGGSGIHQEFTFPRALIRQCRVVFRDDLPKPLEQLLVDNLSEAGVQDLILESEDNGWLNLSRRVCGLFGIKSLRSLSLNCIQVSKYSGRRRLSPLGCAFLNSIKMEFCFVRVDFLHNLLASCRFLETLQLFFCYGFEPGMGRLSIHSVSIKHLVLLCMLPGIDAIDIHGPKLESLTVDVVNELRIEAPKVRNASFLLSLNQPVDPPVALKYFLGAAFRRGAARLMLNSNKTPNGLAAQNGIDEFKITEYQKNAMIFDLNFNLKDQSSTIILTQFLKKCNNYDTRFDILTHPTHIKSINEDDHLLHGYTEVELISLQMRMPRETFEGFLLNQKEMTEEMKRMGLQMLRSRTSREQFEDVLLESKGSLFQVSSGIVNCIEMKF